MIIIEDIRRVKPREGDEDAALIVFLDGVYKLQVLVDSVWIDFPKPEELERESR